MKQYHNDEELANTVLIADMCEPYNILGPPNPPEFNCPSGYSTKRISPLYLQNGMGTKDAAC